MAVMFPAERLSFEAALHQMGARRVAATVKSKLLKAASVVWAILYCKRHKTGRRTEAAARDD